MVSQLKLVYDIPIIYGKPKRVHYRNTTYTKYYTNDVQNDGSVIDDAIYGKMQQIYIAVGNWVSISADEPDCFDCAGLRIWNDRYNTDNYIYNGSNFRGQQFSCRMAEIIGTARLDINERLSIHEEFLKLMRVGYEIKEAVNKCRMKLK